MKILVAGAKGQVGQEIMRLGDIAAQKSCCGLHANWLYQS
jgi:dTDP-4-dehydrorhamnose reductase